MPISQVTQRVKALNARMFAMMHAQARECDLKQAQYTESLYPLITKHAYEWEADFVTVFHVFARHGCTEAVTYFLDQGYDPDMINKIQNYIYIISPEGISRTDHEWTNYTQMTPLMYALLWNQESIAKLLISKGAGLNLYDTHDRATPLMYAAKHNLTETVSLLLDKGVICNMTDVFGDTARQIAFNKGYLDIVGKIDNYTASHP